MKMLRIDHVHIYVEDIQQAEAWYNRVLNFERDDKLLFWFEQGGPLVIKNNDAVLSLFLRRQQAPGHTVAFRMTASDIIKAVSVLSKHQIPYTLCDHTVSVSVYFTDPSDNRIELTCYEYDAVKATLLV